MPDNYVSPYGWGPVTDAVIDCVADRHSMTTSQMSDAFEQLSVAKREELEYRMGENWWMRHMGPAVDAMDDLLSEFVEVKP